MGKVLSEYRAKVIQTILDNSEQLGDTEAERYDLFINEAVFRYSRDRPQELIKDFTGDSTYDYEMPSTFVIGFSHVISVENPTGEQFPSFVDNRYWTVYRSSSGNYLRLLDRSPTSSQTIRMTYTGYHTVTDSAGTIEDADFDAVCTLACALAARAIAARYAEDTSASISADSINFRTIPKEWMDLANQWEKAYRDHMTSSAIGSGPAICQIKNLDAAMLVTGERRDFLFHRQRLR